MSSAVPVTTSGQNARALLSLTATLRRLTNAECELNCTKPHRLNTGMALIVFPLGSLYANDLMSVAFVAFDLVGARPIVLDLDAGLLRDRSIVPAAALDPEATGARLIRLVSEVGRAGGDVLGRSGGRSRGRYGSTRC